ncbi:MAG TPA: ABC transporter substrate-binding protein [Candidatus Methylomirabilis sp.]|nr:ABC transporter substrate-binding protein [Candidatus Methylomirabilis sp.]
MRTARPRFWCGVMLLTTCLLSTDHDAIRAADAPTGGTLVLGLDQEPPTLDPHASPSAVTYQIIASVTESLLYRGPDGKLVPWLAESWTTSRDGRSVTFKLRRDVKFQDGTPFNADAVKFNFDRIVDPGFKAGGARAALAGYAGSKVLDEYTVQVSFETPYAPFLNAAASGVLSMVSPKAVRGTGDLVHTQPVGTGPFMIKEYVAKDHTTMTRNPAYARKAPWSDRSGPARLDAVVWKFIPEAGTRVTTLESGETQGIYLVPAQSLPRLEKNAAIRIEKMPWPGVPRIWLLNTTKPPFDDVRVRRAVNYAVDKEAFLATVYKGTGLKAIAPLTAVMLDDPSLRQFYPHDPARAQALLGEAGWAPGSDGIRTKGGQRLEIVLNAIEYGGGPDPTAQLIQASLRDVGIDVKIKAQARPPWYEDNYRCATHGPVMFLRSTDPDGLFALFHSSLVGSNFNWSCVKNAKLDEMLEQGRRESDPGKRRAIYLAIEKLALDDALTVPLVDELSVWAFRSTVQGVVYNFNAYPVLSDVSLKR